MSQVLYVTDLQFGVKAAFFFTENGPCWDMSIPLLPVPSPELLNFVVGGVNTLIARPGEWMPTYTGRRFYPLHPSADDVALEDVSIGLARQPRFTGQTRWNSRVAPHSVLVSLLCPPDEAEPALFHDSPEAYIGDQTRPMKDSMRQEGADVFDRIEAGILRAVFDHFQIPTAHERGVPDAVKWAPSLPPEARCKAMVGKIVKCADTAAAIIESVALYGYHEVRTWKIGPQIPWGEAWVKHYQAAAEDQNHALLEVGHGIPNDIFRRIIRSQELTEQEAAMAFELRYRDLVYLRTKASSGVTAGK
jgi:5'-deoxynucleotidase YfbR-like HD superfamily hydrolase